MNDSTFDIFGLSPIFYSNFVTLEISVSYKYNLAFFLWHVFGLLFPCFCSSLRRYSNPQPHEWNKLLSQCRKKLFCFSRVGISSRVDPQRGPMFNLTAPCLLQFFYREVNESLLRPMHGHLIHFSETVFQSTIQQFSSVATSFNPTRASPDSNSKHMKFSFTHLIISSIKWNVSLA